MVIAYGVLNKITMYILYFSQSMSFRYEMLSRTDRNTQRELGPVHSYPTMVSPILQIFVPRTLSGNCNFEAQFFRSRNAGTHVYDPMGRIQARRDPDSNYSNV